MRILKLDRKNRLIKVVPEVLDDQWHIERTIEKGDIVSGSTDRKVKREEFQKAERVKLFLKLETISTEFHRFSGKLRVLGKILEGKPEEFVEIGSHHSLDLELGEQVEIQKKEWKEYQIKRLEKARDSTNKGKILLCVLDDEIASFALLKEFEIEEKGNIFSHRPGKMFAQEKGTENKYYSEIVEKVQEIQPDKIVFAGPGFTKESLKKYLEEKPLEKKVKVFFDSTNSVGITGIHELIKKDILEKIVEEMQLIKETKIVESLLQELGKETGKAVIGLEKVEEAAKMGSIQTIIVNEECLLEHKEKVSEILKKTEELGGEIHLVVSEHEASKKLKAMGGIAALLRYSVKS